MGHTDQPSLRECRRGSVHGRRLVAIPITTSPCSTCDTRVGKIRRVTGTGGAAEGMQSAHGPQVEAGLRSGKTATFEAAVQAAVKLGAEGDRLLAGLEGLRGWRALYVTAALGDVVGPRGGDVLRRTIASRGPRTSDLRCSALLALAKREIEGASETLSEAVSDADAAVREYALLGLAAVGDGRAWDAVNARLTAMLARQRARDSEPSNVVLAVVYLLRHVADDRARAAAVVSLLQWRWNRLFDAEQRWLAEHWPAVLPSSGATDEPELPDPAALQRWLLDHPLFAKPALS